MNKKDLLNSIFGNDQGAALIVSLLVMLVLVLLGLAILLQSDTEYQTAKNEEEAAQALHYAEAGLEWGKREIIDFADTAAFTTSNFTDLLNGPNADLTVITENNLLGLRDLSLADTDLLVSGNEQTASAIVSRDFGNGPLSYEAFRIGVDQDGVTTTWEGPRTLVYVRIDDNYDEYPATNNNQVDTDMNISLTAVAEYPIFVNADGSSQTALRGVGRRTLVTRIGPQLLQAAIVVDGSLLLNGVPRTCGDCGSIHANVNMSVSGNAKVCVNLTSTGAYTQSGTPVVGGDKGGGRDPIFVPTINPYDEVLVPVPSNFTGLTNFGCNHNDCATGGGTCKYFAFIPRLDGSAGGLVYKAYWDSSAARPNPKSGNPVGGWKWRLIEDLSGGSPDKTRLDNCGRVVSGNVGGVPLVADAGAGAAVNDTEGNNIFYGFTLAGNYQSPQSCSGDNSLCGTCNLSENDYNRMDYYDYATNSVVSNGNLPLFPGSFDHDGIRDFDNSKLRDGAPSWDAGIGNVIYTPLYNSVIWVYGRTNLQSNPGNRICGGGQNCGDTGSLSIPPGGLWAASFISVGDINISGNGLFAPANSSGNFAFMFITGRDLLIGGNAGAGQSKCGSGDPCNEVPSNPALYAGIMAAHEQVKNNGNYSFDGFMFIEDAVDCSTGHTRSGGYFDFSGNPDIHYDCINPPNPWQDKVRVTSWKEVQ